MFSKFSKFSLLFLSLSWAVFVGTASNAQLSFPETETDEMAPTSEIEEGTTPPSQIEVDMPSEGMGETTTDLNEGATPDDSMMTPDSAEVEDTSEMTEYGSDEEAEAAEEVTDETDSPELVEGEQEEGEELVEGEEEGNEATPVIDSTPATGGELDKPEDDAI